MSSSDFEQAFDSSEPPRSGNKGRSGFGEGPRRWGGPVIGFVVMAVLLLAFITGRGGIVEIEDAQVAVVVNYLNGEVELFEQPGYQIFLPFVKQAFLFDKSPQKFFMQGNEDRSENHVTKLTVRASDGSNLFFEEVEIQYELIPSKAGDVLYDSGPGDSFKLEWIRSFARSILRDEFGKFSATQVADPTVYGTATAEVRAKLNEMLEPHGVKIIQIVTPKPKFDAAYEKAIEDRKLANQEVERMRTKAQQLKQERDRRLASIDAERAVEFEVLKGELEKSRVDADRERVRVERSADAYSRGTVAEGEARRSRLTEEARGMADKARKEAEGLSAKIAALEKQGEVLVRERLAQRLSEMSFELVPYTRDPAPDRVQLEGAEALLEGGK